MNQTLESAVAAFRDAFHEGPTILARAPGRVELLGNHTDYNDGLVLGAAIDRCTVVAGRPSRRPWARFRSVHFGAETAFSIGTEGADPTEAEGWRRYVQGVARAVAEDHQGAGAWTSGGDAVIAGDLPMGAGLSSSASLQAAVALFLVRSRGASTDLVDDDRMALARVLQRSENVYAGVASGLLDPFMVLFGAEGRALSLDCRSFEYERLPLGDPAPAIVVCDSKTSRRLADGMYNRRRAECESVVSAFRSRPGFEAVRALRDLAAEDLVDAWDGLDPVGRLRARHVVAENARVREGSEALRRGDLPAFGRLMSASHASSRDDFGNSSPALDSLIAAAEDAPGFLGGKLSGAGWAGCTVNLVNARLADSFAEAVQSRHARETGVVPDVHVCRASDGASVRGGVVDDETNGPDPTEHKDESP